MKITEALFAEHLVFHNMFDHIEATAPKLKTLAEVKSLAALMEQLLKAHSDTEDELFIGPLEHCFEQIGQRDAFLEEHQEIDDSLKNVQGARQFKRRGNCCCRRSAYSRKHFDKEERIVFPMAERVLNSKTLTALGQRGWNRERGWRCEQAGARWARVWPQAVEAEAKAVLTLATSAAMRAESGKPEALPRCRKAASCE